MGGEAQYAMLIFGDAPAHLTEAVSDVIRVAQRLATDDVAAKDAALWPVVQEIAEHLRARESDFATEFESIRAALADQTVGWSASKRNAQVRVFTRSSEFLRTDAVATIERTYRQCEKTIPHPIPEAIVERVMQASGVGASAAALVLERVLCDEVNLDHDRIRNLLWDQAIATNVGQSIKGLAVLLVTDDHFFAEAASVHGVSSSVMTLAQYKTHVGIPAG